MVRNRPPDWASEVLVSSSGLSLMGVGPWASKFLSFSDPQFPIRKMGRTEKPLTLTLRRQTRKGRGSN